MRAQWILSILFLLSIAINLVISRDPAQRNLRIPNEMATSPALNSFDPTPHFSSGAALQLPPSGTVPLSMLPLPYQATTEDAELAGRELQGPFPLDEASAVRGRRIFEDFCTPCHGPEGAGDGTVVSRGFPAPPSLTAEAARNLPDGTLFHLLSFGRGNMPSYQTQLSRRERWLAIGHVRLLQQEASNR